MNERLDFNSVLKGTIIGIQWAKEMHGFNLIKSNTTKERI